MNALLSVSDKTGLVDFARGLLRLGVTLYATGGTERALREAGVEVHALSELTGFPELLDGRVKTLHPNVHAGILARRDDPSHMQEVADHGMKLIDLVVVNLYPFVETVASGAGHQETIESIDIGGVTLLRAAAKNYDHVLPVVRPSDYPSVLQALADGGVPPTLRRHLAALAFAHTAAYDAAIGHHLHGPATDAALPQDFTLGGHKLRDLRYGENPHQSAALYRTAEGGGIADAKQWQGLELSYNNLLDAQAAWSLVNDFADPAVAIIKHANPCGVALGESPAETFDRAFNCDPRSAFGGIAAFNRPIDEAAAQRVVAPFLEVVVAPSIDPAALEIFKRRPKLRVLQPGSGPANPALEVRPITGGFLVQTADPGAADTLADVRVVTKVAPDDAAWVDLRFAWTVVKHVRSNAIVLALERAAVGIGAGQMSRVEAVELAVRRAGERAAGSALASDGFFPYPDNVQVAARAGVRAIVQPGGSVKDSEAIAAADAAGIAMVFTGERHFKH